MAESETLTAGSSNGRGEATAAERKNATKIINIVYVIAALDVTWMFLQFSVTPVSINAARRSSEPRFPRVREHARRRKRPEALSRVGDVSFLTADNVT